MRELPGCRSIRNFVNAVYEFAISVRPIDCSGCVKSCSQYFSGFSRRCNAFRGSLLCYATPSDVGIAADNKFVR